MGYGGRNLPLAPLSRQQSARHREDRSRLDGPHAGCRSAASTAGIATDLDPNRTRRRCRRGLILDRVGRADQLDHRRPHQGGQVQGPGIAAEVEPTGLEQRRQVEKRGGLRGTLGGAARRGDDRVGERPIVSCGARGHHRGHTFCPQATGDLCVPFHAPTLVRGRVTGARMNRDRRGPGAQGLGCELYPLLRQLERALHGRLGDAQIADQGVVAPIPALAGGIQLGAFAREPIGCLPSERRCIGDPAGRSGQPCQSSALQDRVEIQHQVEALGSKRHQPAAAGLPEKVRPGTAQRRP